MCKLHCSSTQRLRRGWGAMRCFAFFHTHHLSVMTSRVPYYAPSLFHTHHLSVMTSCVPHFITLLRFFHTHHLSVMTSRVPHYVDLHLDVACCVNVTCVFGMSCFRVLRHVVQVRRV